MPKISKGLEYFNVDTDINNDMRVRIFRAEFGMKGFGVWVQLLIQIYSDEGYFMKWDKDTKLLFASDVGETGGLVDEVVNGLVRRGLFNKTVFNSSSVLTSKHIQEKYLNAIKRRTTKTKIDVRYLVIPVDVDIITDNDNIKLLNVNKKKQSRVEYSKVEDSRVNNAREVDSFTGIDHKNLHRLKEPLTIEELQKLRDDFEDDMIIDVLIAMENHKKLTTKYKSAYLTALNWCKRRHNDSKNGKQSKGDKRAKQLREIEQEWPG